MDTAFSDLEFLDLSGVSAQEAEKIQKCLGETTVELPWKLEEEQRPVDSDNGYETGEVGTTGEDPTLADGSGDYAPPPLLEAPLSHPETMMMTPAACVASPSVAIPAVSTMGPFPPQLYPFPPVIFPPYAPYVPHHLAPHGNQEIVMQQSQLPLAYSGPIVPDIHGENRNDEMLDPKQKRSPNDKRFLRNKKKHQPMNYYVSPDVGGAEAYQHVALVMEDHMQPGLQNMSSGHGNSEQLPTVVTTMAQSLPPSPFVPLNLPASGFAVSGAPLPVGGHAQGYPPGIPAIAPFPHMTSPQLASTPMVYVYTSPYHQNYLRQATVAAVGGAPSPVVNSVHPVVTNSNSCPIPNMVHSQSGCDSGVNSNSPVQSDPPEATVEHFVNQNSLPPLPARSTDQPSDHFGQINIGSEVNEEPQDESTSRASNSDSGSRASPGQSSPIPPLDVNKILVSEPTPCQDNISDASNSFGEPPLSDGTPRPPQSKPHEVSPGALSPVEFGNSSAASSSCPQRRSWADLFKKGSEFHSPDQQSPDDSSIHGMTDHSPNSTKHSSNRDSEDGSDGMVSTSEDNMAVIFGEAVSRIRLDHSSRYFKPRGLTNRSNWCYINATLQALLACPPLFNLLRKMPSIPEVERGKSSTPTLDSMVEFINEFGMMPYTYKNKRKEELTEDPPFEPLYIYKMLSVVKSECVKGRQEDAEEFLSCILNGLHDEMLSVMKTVQKGKETSNGDVAANGHLEDSGDDEGWQVMGPKNKSMVTRSASLSRSPISTIFGGQMRSVLNAGNEVSAFLQSFFTLQLDIQAEGGQSVREALSCLTGKEPIQGYTCTKTKQEVEAYRRTTLDVLPAVLILHFKRFLYDDKNGGCKKIVKKTDYTIDLELTKELLSQEVRAKYAPRHLRTYKLFAVVYHEGKEAVKGHYVADVFHAGSAGWLRCDDQIITRITEAQLLRYDPPRVPYLLFYRRFDTLQATFQSKS